MNRNHQLEICALFTTTDREGIMTYDETLQ